MQKIGSSSRRHRAGRISVGVVIIVCLTLAVAGVVLAFRGILGGRASNDLTRYLPADTLAVATLDLLPTTMEQVEGLKSLSNALTSVNWSDYIDNDESPLESRRQRDAEELLKTLDGKAVLGMWQAGSNETAGALVASTRDAKATEIALTKIARRSRVEDGMTVYTLRVRGGFATGYAAVIDKTLVLASDRAALLRVREIGKKSSPALSGVAEFREARKRLPSGVLLAVYASPKAYEETAKNSANVKWTKSAQAAFGWSAAGLTLKKDGFLLDGGVPCDSDALTELKILAKIPALDTNALNRLPDGAVGTLALSQPSAVAEFIQEVADEEPSAEEVYERFWDQFEDATGVSLEKDVLPGLKGNTLVALYPNRQKNGADGVMLIDNANGAEPSQLADVVRTLYAQNKQSPALIESEKYGATIWRVPTSANSHAGRNITVTEWGTGKQESILAETEDAVLLASSSAVLERALQNKGQNGGVPTAGSGEDTYLLSGAQSLLTISPEKALASMTPSGQVRDDMTSSLRHMVTPDSHAPLTLSLRYDGKVLQSRLFVPVNYAATAQAIAEGVRKNQTTKNISQYE